ncbi:HEPN domain protein [Ferroglobus placidus DSM 10642]|uniref:HEPN domain protein n=1 Tax=Ferroglobus placidus (strain DSM 10642 / AEDII12DO) TaxID=589924 RepID=D3S0T1_FERPA|nr:HEPN domain-containing protein [Ferroglobus placidus]ADC66322.1 HEPN domain protein [Ferroglobus placidus DSM 10642]
MNLDNIEQILESPEKLDSLLKLLMSLERILESQDEQRYLEAKRFVESANEDLKASQILYNAGLYSSAVFHMQQATEKYFKAIAIYYFGLSKKNIRKYVKHDTPKIAILFLRKYQNIVKDLTMFFKDIVPEKYLADTSREYILNLERLINTNKRDIAQLNKEEIYKLIKLTRSLVESLESDDTKNKILNTLQDLNNNKSKIVNKILEVLNLSQISESKLDQIKKQIIKALDVSFTEAPHNVEIALKLASSICMLFFLGIITYPHATFTRYRQKSAPQYDIGLGIVDSFRDLLELLQLASDNINNLFNI